MIVPAAGTALFACALYWLRRRARSSGVNDRHPVCSACGYGFSGWRRSTCPECGVDARRHGVRIHPRGRRRWTIAWSVVFVLVAVTPPLLAVHDVISWRDILTRSVHYHHPDAWKQVEFELRAPQALNQSWPAVGVAVTVKTYGGEATTAFEWTLARDGSAMNADDAEAVRTQLATELAPAISTMERADQRALVDDVAASLRDLRHSTRVERTSDGSFRLAGAAPDVASMSRGRDATGVHVSGRVGVGSWGIPLAILLALVAAVVLPVALLPWPTRSPRSDEWAPGPTPGTRSDAP